MKFTFDMEPQEFMGMMGLIKDYATAAINHADKRQVIDREREKMNDQRKDFERRVDDLKREHEETERRLRKELDDMNRKYAALVDKVSDHSCGCHCDDTTDEEDL